MMVWIEHRIHISSKRKKSEEIADSVVKFSKHVCSDVVMCVFVSNYSLYTSKGSYSPTLVYISLLVFAVDLWIHICSYIYTYMFAFFLWGYLDWKSDGELKGSSDSFSLMSMSRVLQQIELEKPSSVWLERVCSFSNPSDMPSRKQTKQAAELFKAFEHGVLRVPPELVDAILTLHREPFASLNALSTGVDSSA